MSGTPRAIIVASHERSGTHLLIDVLRRNFAECRARPRPLRNPHDWLYFSADRLREAHPRAVGTDFADRALARARLPIVKTHMLPDWPRLRAECAEWFHDLVEHSVILYVHRDGRDVAPSFQRLRQRIDASTPANFSEFIRSEVDGMNVPQRWADHVMRWLGDGRAHGVSFKGITRDTNGVLGQLAELMGARPLGNADPLPPRAGTAWQSRFARLTGRMQSSNLVAQGGFGPPVKWKDALDRDDRAFFHQHAGAALIRAGYAESDAWVDEPSPRPRDER